MTFKKIMLLASMAMAAVAFAAPAAHATAPVWKHSGTTITEPAPIHIVGNLASTTGSGFISGPCEVTFVGTAENSAGAAAGQIEGGEFPEHICETNVATCEITPTVSNFPWKITGTTVTGGKGIAIDNATFTNHYIGECPVPFNPIAASGTATGIVETNGCVSFENHQDDMAIEGLPVAINILGTVCDTTLTLG